MDLMTKPFIPAALDLIVLVDSTVIFLYEIRVHQAVGGNKEKIINILHMFR